MRTPAATVMREVNPRLIAAGLAQVRRGSVQPTVEGERQAGQWFRDAGEHGYEILSEDVAVSSAAMQWLADTGRTGDLSYAEVSTLLALTAMNAVRRLRINRRIKR